MKDFHHCEQQNTGHTGTEKAEIKTTLISRNITVSGRRTSVRLEPEMWSALRDIARREHCSIHDICSLIGIRKNPQTSLTAAIRVFIMLYFRASSTEDGHSRAGHGNFEFMIQRARLQNAPNQSVERFKNQVQAGVRVNGNANQMRQYAH